MAIVTGFKNGKSYTFKNLTTEKNVESLWWANR